MSGEAWKADVGRWQEMIRSGGLPKHIDTPQKAIAIARMGEVYGWDAMRSVRNIYVVEGRPEMSAESMLALIREKCPDAVIMPGEVSDSRVVISVQRPPMPDAVDVIVTYEMFKHRPLKTKYGKPTNWVLYREDMLWARCVSRMGRRFFSDVTAGAYTIGELSEGDAGLSVRQVLPTRSSIVDDLDQRDDVEPEDAEVVTSEDHAEAHGVIEDDPLPSDRYEFNSDGDGDDGTVSHG